MKPGERSEDRGRTDPIEDGTQQQPGARGPQPRTATITITRANKAPAGPTSRRREVMGPISEGKKDKASEGKRKAGRPPAQTDRRILEAVIRLHAEGHPWPRLRERLEPISKKYGGPYPLSTEQARRLARKAADILSVKLKKRRDGRRYDYYRQVDNVGGAY